MSQTLYEQLGGKEAIGAVVNIFYDKILADDRVNKFFKNSDMEKQRRHQTLFLSWVTGGPNQYSGTSMEKAHAGLNLQEEHFQAVTENLVASLKEVGVQEEQINHIVDKLLTMKDDILHKER